jgi:putative phosphoribosyl transferase
MVELLSKEADEVVCLSIEPSFWAVGQFYEDFSPVEDSEVLATLNEFARTAVADATERVELQRDGVRLVGNLLVPASPAPHPLVVFVHGLGSGKDSPRNVVIAHRLVDAGIATLLFDLSGHGESGHDLRRTEMDAYVADLETMFTWVTGRKDVRRDSIGIAGSSMGATIAVAALLEGKVSPKTMVLRGPPVTAEDFRRISVPSLVLIGSRDPLHYDVERGASGCQNLTLSVVEGAGHLFEEPGKLEEALHKTVDWFRSQLEPQSAGVYAKQLG